MPKNRFATILAAIVTAGVAISCIASGFYMTYRLVTMVGNS